MRVNAVLGTVLFIVIGSVTSNVGSSEAGSGAAASDTANAPANATANAPAPAANPAPQPDANTAQFAGFTEAQRKSMLTANIAFGKDEADGFWPLYRDYRRDMTKWQDRRSKALNEYAEIFRTMTGDQADAILEDVLQADEGIGKVKRDYLKKFRKFLPDTKVARFYLIDAKIDLAGEAMLMTKVQTIGEAPR
jgi:pyruvate/2-oxoglutarate dehydrogenase complex dihydrolipoamide acyltransferase (E2) component